MRKFALTLAAAGCWALLPAHAAAQAKPAARHRAAGPAFCRSGGGHPVFGRAWCIEKGYSLGHDQWRQVDFAVVLAIPAQPGRMEHDSLQQMLGDEAFARFDAQRTDLGLADPLDARWLLPAKGPAVLQLWSGPWPVAEIVDHERDGKADFVVMNFRR